MAEKILGIDQETHKQRFIDGQEWHVIRPDGIPMQAEESAGVRALRENQIFEDREVGIDKPNGDKIWLNVTAAPIPLENYGVVVAYGDITARREAQARIHFQATLLDAVGQAVIATDLAGNITYFNRAAEELYGWPAAEALGRNIMAVTVPDTSLAQAEEIMAALSQGQTWSGEFEVRHRDGTVFLAEVFDSPVHDKSGQLVGVIGVSADITARKQAEQQLKSSLDEKNVLLQELYHRTKNNMFVIQSLLSLQSRYIEDEQALAAIADTQNRIQSMAMVHHKLYQGKNLSRIDLKDYISDLAGHLMRSYGRPVERIAIVENMDSVEVLIDSAMPCGLVLNELISNALKHAFPDGRTGEIRISLHKNSDEEINLEVADNGVGLPAGLDPRQAGTLGLITVFNLVERQLHGQIRLWAESGVVCQITFKDNMYKPRV